MLRHHAPLYQELRRVGGGDDFVRAILKVRAWIWHQGSAEGPKLGSQFAKDGFGLGDWLERAIEKRNIEMVIWIVDALQDHEPTDVEGYVYFLEVISFFVGESASAGWAAGLNVIANLLHDKWRELQGLVRGKNLEEPSYTPFAALAISIQIALQQNHFHLVDCLLKSCRRLGSGDAFQYCTGLLARLLAEHIPDDELVWRYITSARSRGAFDGLKPFNDDSTSEDLGVSEDSDTKWTEGVTDAVIRNDQGHLIEYLPPFQQDDFAAKHDALCKVAERIIPKNLTNVLQTVVKQLESISSQDFARNEGCCEALSKVLMAAIQNVDAVTDDNKEIAKQMLQMCLLSQAFSAHVDIVKCIHACMRDIKITSLRDVFEIIPATVPKYRKAILSSDLLPNAKKVKRMMKGGAGRRSGNRSSGDAEGLATKDDHTSSKTGNASTSNQKLQPMKSKEQDTTSSKPRLEVEPYVDATTGEDKQVTDVTGKGSREVVTASSNELVDTSLCGALDLCEMKESSHDGLNDAFSSAIMQSSLEQLQRAHSASNEMGSASRTSKEAALSGSDPVQEKVVQAEKRGGRVRKDHVEIDSLKVAVPVPLRIGDAARSSVLRVGGHMSVEEQQYPTTPNDASSTPSVQQETVSDARGSDQPSSTHYPGRQVPWDSQGLFGWASAYRPDGGNEGLGAVDGEVPLFGKGAEQKDVEAVQGVGTPFVGGGDLATFAGVVGGKMDGEGEDGSGAVGGKLDA
ncbi:hypothetical protein HDV00_005251 [Rhizophlyctis rosea]|nr:hypothetical protein HDV00_005251 [Rhizophlyctis rosea]